MSEVDQDEKASGQPSDETGRTGRGSAEPADYEFAALIKTKQGHYLQQNFRGVESFRQKMKEQANRIAWAVLLRCDTGISVDLFHSGQRQKIGLVDTQPGSAGGTPVGLNPIQVALREAAIGHFKSKKLSAFIAEQVKYINASRQIGEGIRFLFDARGRPSENARIEEITEERDKTEIQLRWLEAICSGLRDNLGKLKDLEESALELIRQDQ